MTANHYILKEDNSAMFLVPDTESISRANSRVIIAQRTTHLGVIIKPLPHVFSALNAFEKDKWKDMRTCRGIVEYTGWVGESD